MAGLPPTIADASVVLTFGSAGQYYGYCAIADVLFEFPSKDAFRSLDNSVVAQEITYAANELQQLLDRTYEMPYVGTNGAILLSLRQINSWLAVANIIDRYFQGSEPDLSPAAAERRSWAELKIVDVNNGIERWGPEVGGDAVPRGMMPVYQLSRAATVTPDPNSLDPNQANPVFSIGLSRFRRGDIM
jgi:hypothetical protein